MNEKISYIKLPNITTSKLQDVVDFLNDNEIEYENIMQKNLQNRIDKAIEYIEKENQELKLELSGYRQAILEDKDMLGLKEESEELKKQLKEYKRLGFKHLNDKCNKLENQQKEFINYLEDEINEHKNKEPFIVVNICSSYDLNDIELKLLEEILQKYKEITRGKDEKEN